MIRPEDAFLPLLAAALLVQTLAGLPLRVEMPGPGWETPVVIDATALAVPEPAPPAPALARDADDHFAGAS